MACFEVVFADGEVREAQFENLQQMVTGDYGALSHKPQINGVVLEGDKSAGDLKIYAADIGAVSCDDALANEEIEAILKS